MERYVARLEDYTGPGRVDPLTGYIIEPETPDLDKPIRQTDPRIDTLTGLPYDDAELTSDSDGSAGAAPFPEGYDRLTGYSAGEEDYI